jgi:hypothetical protein
MTSTPSVTKRRAITSLALLAGGAALGAVGTFALTNDAGAVEAAADPVVDEAVGDNMPLSCTIYSVPALDTSALALLILTDGSPYVIVCQDSTGHQVINELFIHHLDR